MFEKLQILPRKKIFLKHTFALWRHLGPPSAQGGALQGQELRVSLRGIEPALVKHESCHLK